MDFINWLFTDRMGVVVLIVAGLVIALIVAFVLERRMRKQYFNHEKAEGEEDSILGSLFDDE